MLMPQTITVTNRDIAWEGVLGDQLSTSAAVTLSVEGIFVL